MDNGKIRDENGLLQPEILFKPASWLDRIEFINHLVLFKQGMITVLAGKTGGKTSFITLMQENLDQQISPVVITANSTLGFEAEILRKLVDTLQINQDTPMDMESVLTEINELKNPVLLIIDEAHYLPGSFLKEVLFFIKNQGKSGFFHLCLVSDYSLLSSLNKLPAGEYNHFIHTLEPGSLSETETRTYLLQRAMAAQLLNRPLTEAQYRQFYNLTQGNLAEINNNLECFIDRCLPKKNRKVSMILKKVNRVMSISLISIIAWMYFENQLNTFSHQSPVQVSSIRPDASEPVSSEIKSEIPESRLVSWREGSVVESGAEIAQGLENKYLPGEYQNAANTGSAFFYIHPIELTYSTAVETQPDKKILQQKQPKTKPTVLRPAPSRVSRPVQAKRKLNQKNTVISRASDLYTIQLLACHRKMEVDLFRKKNNLLGKTKIRHITNEKGSWYLLTYGEYVNRQQARAGMGKLSDKLTKLNPWIRTVTG